MNKIKQARNKKGYTLRKLSIESGIALSYVYALENGDKENPSKKTMDKIAEALETTTAELFY